jgi:4a-hydroxytetrahydrobiopterin dehydratase
MSWKENNKRLEKIFTFKNQTELAQFFLKVAEIADKMNHHPDVEIKKCSELKLSLCTHDAGNSITEKDYGLAKEIDLIVVGC